MTANGHTGIRTGDTGIPSARGGNIPWVDIFKGIGILLVALGHSTAYFSKMIYVFHMPMFFFISGFLFRPAPAGDYIRRKARHILVPYMFFMAVFLLPFVLTGQQKHPDNTAWTYIKALVFGGRLLDGPLLIFWFPTCLLVTQIVFNWAASLPKSALAAAMAASLALAYANYIFCREMLIPWDANVALYALPVFWLGYLLRGHPQWLGAVTGKYALPAVALTVAVMAAAWFYPLALDMRDAEYGIPVLSLLCGILAILGVIALSRFITDQLPFLGRILGICGAASMVIMYVHHPVNILMRHIDAHNLVNFAAQIVVSLAVFFIFDRFALLRRIALGADKRQTPDLPGRKS